MSYASGKYARSICDRCGFAFDYTELQEQVENQRLTGLFVCHQCMDIDHEQHRLNTLHVVDPQALRDARPQSNSERAFFGWPVMTGLLALGRVGQVRVTTS